MAAGAELQLRQSRSRSLARLLRPSVHRISRSFPFPSIPLSSPPSQSTLCQLPRVLQRAQILRGFPMLVDGDTFLPSFLPSFLPYASLINRDLISSMLVAVSDGMATVVQCPPANTSRASSVNVSHPDRQSRERRDQSSFLKLNLFCLGSFFFTAVGEMACIVGRGGMGCGISDKRQTISQNLFNIINVTMEE